MVNDFLDTLKEIESTVVQGILMTGIQDNEIVTDNDYVVQNEGENVAYRNNSVLAVFSEIYSPMREYGSSRPLGLNIHQENVYVNKKLINVYAVTLGYGLITVAEGREENMKVLNQTLNKMVLDETIKDLVKKSFKEGRLMCKSEENKILKVLNGYHWIPRPFKADIRRSRRDELTS